MRLKREFDFFVRFASLVKNWPLYVVNRVWPIQYRMRERDARIWVRPEDRCAFNDVFIAGQYNASIPWEGFKRIIDIGANVGAFTVFASLKSPGATILAIEPEPLNFALLRKNISLNNISAICRQAVVSASGGRRRLFLSHLPGQHALFGTGDSMEVDSIPLAELLETDCDLLKLDFEGSEYEIVYSLPQELWNRIRYILLEYHYPTPTDSPVILREYLEKMGYTVTTIGRRILLAQRA
jgi:FkbM family methyltransferase